MKLECETILDIYTHKNLTILCQIKVQPSNTIQQSRGWKNTCRCITQEQWKSFDKELSNLLEELRAKQDKWKDEIICTFIVEPNIEVKVQKSKLSSSNFYNFMGADGDADGVIDNTVCILELILDFKQQPPSVSQEYEPNSKYNSPLSYEPYTPSKKKYRANSLDGIKTPGVDFLGYDSSEEMYLPEPVSENIKANFPYKPARIKETRSSNDSQTSSHSCCKDETIPETDDELVPRDKFLTIRSKVLRKQSKREIEYIPESQEIIEAPAYLPTTCAEGKKDSQENNKSSKDNNNDKKRVIDTLKEDPKHSKKKHLKISKKDVRGRSNKILEYKEKLPSKYDKSNQEKVRQILERPQTSCSSDDGVGCLASDANNAKKLDVDIGIQNSKETNSEIEAALNISLSSGTASATTDVSTLNKITKEKRKKSRHHDTGQLRRSERSPTKPKRLIEEQFNKGTNKKLVTKISSSKNKDFFGTDSDDDNDDKDFQKHCGDNNNNAAKKKIPYILHTPKCEIPKKSSSSSSSKKKRKRDKSSECEQEKRDIKQWLGKKKTNSDLEAATTSKEKSKSSKRGNSSKNTTKSNATKPESPQPIEFVIPTKEELENIRVKTKLQKEENEKLKAELEKISAPPPKEVKHLSLTKMSVNELLDTFSDHKPVLDEIYEKNRKKDHIKSHNGINHCFIIRLMEPETQYKMLQKLTDAYSNTNSTTQATLYANAMLPEWIMHVYMKKYNFTREQAMQQIKAQDDYQLYIDEQNDNSFMLEMS